MFSVPHAFLLISCILLRLCWICLVEICSVPASQHHIIKYWLNFFLRFLSEIESHWISSFNLTRLVNRLNNRALSFVISNDPSSICRSRLCDWLFLLLSRGKLINLLMFVKSLLWNRILLLFRFGLLFLFYLESTAFFRSCSLLLILLVIFWN